MINPNRNNTIPSRSIKRGEFKKSTESLGTLNVRLSELLYKLVDSIRVYPQSPFLSNIKYNEIDFTLSIFGPFRYLDIFDPQFFLSNFKKSFGVKFKEKNLNNRLPYKLVIDNDLPIGGIPNISEFELRNFRLICCTYFGIKYGIELLGCECYPKSKNEYLSTSSGIGLNCINLDCKNSLINNPHLFDNLIHTDCMDINFNAVFLSLKALKSANLDIDNINIMQNNLNE